MPPRAALLIGLVLLCSSVGRLQAAEPAPEPTLRQRQLDAWWARQREKEASDRFWNGPREARRNLTRDQIERWETDRDRRRGWRGAPY